MKKLRHLATQVGLCHYCVRFVSDWLSRV